MIFALLFFFSFVIGVIAYLVTDKWWIGGVVSGALLLVITLSNVQQDALQGIAFYFGFPIVFLGSLFGAYIVQLRRAPELDNDEISANKDSSTNQNSG